MKAAAPSLSPTSERVTAVGVAAAGVIVANVVGAGAAGAVTSGVGVVSAPAVCFAVDDIATIGGASAVTFASGFTIGFAAAGLAAEGAVAIGAAVLVSPIEGEWHPTSTAVATKVIAIGMMFRMDDDAYHRKPSHRRTKITPAKADCKTPNDEHLLVNIGNFFEMMTSK